MCLYPSHTQLSSYTRRGRFVIRIRIEAGRRGAKGILAVWEEYAMYPKRGWRPPCFED
jgi:hypothetical protein